MQRSESINSNLATALNLLGIREVTARDDKEQTQIASPKEHAKALFANLNMAGYLNDDLLRKAVEHLAAAKPFSCDNETVFSDLKQVCDLSNQGNQFNVEFFIANFAKQTYFAVDDVVDLIVFFQQTAFARPHGVERDRVPTIPWIEENKIAFIENVTKLGVIVPLQPQKDRYIATGIMGASSGRAKKRLEYFKSLKTDCDLVLALSGNRELSKGLDEEKVMEEVATHFQKPVNYVKKKVGTDTREFLDGITETMMMNYLIKIICPNKKISTIDSAVESGHWRATTAQSAVDVVPIIIDNIQSEKITPTADNRYHFLIVAEQPYTERMTMQVQREFNKEIKKRGLEGKLFIEVEGCGPGLLDKDLDSGELARVNSELGALMAERFYNARSVLQQTPGLVLRDPKILMFSTRDETLKLYQAQAKQQAPALTMM